MFTPALLFIVVRLWSIAELTLLLAPRRQDTNSLAWFYIADPFMDRVGIFLVLLCIYYIGDQEDRLVVSQSGGKCMIAGRGGPSIKFRSFDKEIECLCKTAAAKITRQTGYSGTSSSWFLHRSGLPVRSAFVVGQDARGRLTPSSAPLTRHATTPEIWGCATTLPHWPANKRSDGTILFVASSRHSAIFAFFSGSIASTFIFT